VAPRGEGLPEDVENVQTPAGWKEEW